MRSLPSSPEGFGARAFAAPSRRAAITALDLPLHRVERDRLMSAPPDEGRPSLRDRERQGQHGDLTFHAGDADDGPRDNGNPRPRRDTRDDRMVRSELHDVLGHDAG